MENPTNNDFEELNDNPVQENQNLISDDEVSLVKAYHHSIQNELKKVIIGQENTVELLLIALLSGGHVLLEGVPGVAKTLTAKMFSKSMELDFSRIQFTPDLMPTDVLGTTVLNMKTSEFSFIKGPIFGNIVLIDEINRAPAKTQAALFEVMEEKQLSNDGTTYKMADPFFVIATQNPIEQEGTYKLPEAQLDRFIFKVKVDYPDLEQEKQILQQYKGDFDKRVTQTVQSILKPENIEQLRQLTEKVYIEDSLVDHIADIVFATRKNKDLYLGASPRASLAILKAAKAKALLSGRNFVTPDDINALTAVVLDHRIILTAERELEGYTTQDVIADILKKIEIPR